MRLSPRADSDLYGSRVFLYKGYCTIRLGHSTRLLLFGCFAAPQRPEVVGLVAVLPAAGPCGEKCDGDTVQEGGARAYELQHRRRREART